MFAKNLFRVFQTEQPTQFGSTASVVSAFTEVSVSHVTPTSCDSYHGNIALLTCCFTVSFF